MAIVTQKLGQYSFVSSALAYIVIIQKHIEYIAYTMVLYISLILIIILIKGEAGVIISHNPRRN